MIESGQAQTHKTLSSELDYFVEHLCTPPRMSNRHSRGQKSVLLLQGVQKCCGILTGLSWAVIETVGTGLWGVRMISILRLGVPWSD